MRNTIEESLAMRLARGAGLERLAWSLRRLHCPVPREALVLEVGSGGNPYPRSNVLLDAYEHTQERHWAPLIADRPTVLGFVENLPFRNRVFDFVIASHVLEHSSQPERFLAELQRVAHAGYIEVPDAFMERINPYRDHRLEITVRHDRLLLRKKRNWQNDPQLVELYEHRAKRWVTSELIPRHPFDFHVRYFWSERIEYEVLDAGMDAGWPAPSEGRTPFGCDPRQGARARLRSLGRAVLSQRARNRRIDLLALLRCTRCEGSDLESRDGALRCRECRTEFPVRQGIPQMIAP